MNPELARILARLARRCDKALRQFPACLDLVEEAQADPDLDTAAARELKALWDTLVSVEAELAMALDSEGLEAVFRMAERAREER